MLETHRELFPNKVFQTVTEGNIFISDLGKHGHEEERQLCLGSKVTALRASREEDILPTSYNTEGLWLRRNHGEVMPCRHLECSKFEECQEEILLA